MVVLVAEGDKHSLNNITDAFGKYLPDFKLKTTDSGEECLEMVKGNCLDLVILGLELADGSGLDVMEQIRGCSEVPIMFLSRKNDGFTLVKALDAGADGYMTLPVHQLEFIARIRAILRRRKIISKQGGVLI